MTKPNIGRLTDVATLLAAVLAIVIGGVAAARHLAPDPVIVEAQPVEGWERYAADGRHRQGSADARITVVEFGDYQCPACRSVEPHLRAALRHFGSELTFIYRHWPLERHALAYPAARAAECAADQGHFWPFHELLYTDDTWLTGDAQAEFMRFAAQVQLRDLDKFQACTNQTEPVAAIETDIETALAIGGGGTPTWVINGLLHRGMGDSLRIVSVIEALLRDQR
jgi:protein-disulfide isomerase